MEPPASSNSAEVSADNTAHARQSVPSDEPSEKNVVDDKLLTPNADNEENKERIRKQSSLRFANRIVEVRDKKGPLQAAIPYVPTAVAWFCLFLNVFLPGTGTLVMALAALCGAKTSSKKQNRCLDFLINLGSGLLQILTAAVIVGWVWSIYWGMYIVTQASELQIMTSFLLTVAATAHFIPAMHEGFIPWQKLP